MLAASAGAADAGHRKDEACFLLAASQLLHRWKVRTTTDKAARMAYQLNAKLPEGIQAQAMADAADNSEALLDALQAAVRQDEEIHELLSRARNAAEQGDMPEILANCVLYEADELVADKAQAVVLVGQATDLLKRALRQTETPHRRGHLMGRIAALYRRLDDSTEALSWLARAGDLFEEVGDVYGLANFHATMADVHRHGYRTDEEVSAYRTVLSLIEGRSFHRLAAGVRINLSAVLRGRREWREAEALLKEAEAICERHHFQDFVAAIARNRSDIEREQDASQAPQQTLSELLDSLHQLIAYDPESSLAYLPFWHFVWQSELMAILRSGPRVSMMLMTDDVGRFLRFAEAFGSLVDHFVMVDSIVPTLKPRNAILRIPPDWRFPRTFQLVAMKKASGEGASGATETDQPPRIKLAGPARVLPLYMLVQSDSDVPGEGRVMALSTPSLPPQAVDLMLRRPITELAQRRAVWIPTERFESDDVFAHDLRLAHERGCIPVYFDRLPVSERVRVWGGTEIVARPSSRTIDPPESRIFSRALLRLSALPLDQARAALLDLPEALSIDGDQAQASVAIEVSLCELDEGSRRLLQPVIAITGV